MIYSAPSIIYGAAGVLPMTAPPETYYEMLDERLPNHGEPVKELQTRGILLDGTTESGKFNACYYRFSQKRWCTLEVNLSNAKAITVKVWRRQFKALFESMERDQICRGALETESAS